MITKRNAKNYMLQKVQKNNKYSTGQKKQWQGWHNTDRKDLIFIMVPCKGNAHRGESTKH